MSRSLEFGTIGLLVVDVIFIVISLSVKYWVYLDTDVSVVYAGLWEMCSKSTDHKGTDHKGTDQKISEIPNGVDLNYITAKGMLSMGDLRTVQSMVILALICVVGALAGIVMKRFVLKDDNKVVLHVEMGALIVAGFFLMVGMSVFVDTIFNPIKLVPQYKGFTLHAGFAFCIISWILSWVGAFLTFMTSGLKFDISTQTGNQQTTE